MEESLRQLAEYLRTMRKERGLRLADLAALTGLSEVHLYRLEQGERAPSVSALLTLASAYGVEPSDLLRGQGIAPGVSKHTAGAEWVGREQDGSGTMFARSTRVRYDLRTRLNPADSRQVDEGAWTGSPEELVGMGFAGCFSMSLAYELDAAGFVPEDIATSATVLLGVCDREVSIIGIDLECTATVAGMSDGLFNEIAQVTRRTCVVARALIAVPVTLRAKLAERVTVAADEDTAIEERQ